MAPCGCTLSLASKNISSYNDLPEYFERWYPGLKINSDTDGFYGFEHDFGDWLRNEAELNR